MNSPLTEAEFENVQNFIPSYKILQDIAETVKYLQIIRYTRIKIDSFFNLTS